MHFKMNFYKGITNEVILGLFNFHQVIPSSACASVEEERGKKAVCQLLDPAPSQLWHAISPT